MSGIADLIERLEKLEGPDRDTDADIYIAFNIPAERAGRIDRLGGCVGWWPKDAPYVSAVDVPSYTASLDAATALVERALPGWQWAAWGGGIEAGASRPRCMAHVSDGRRQWTASDTPNASIALCLATLRALQQEDRR